MRSPFGQLSGGPRPAPSATLAPALSGSPVLPAAGAVGQPVPVTWPDVSVRLQPDAVLVRTYRILRNGTAITSGSSPLAAFTPTQAGAFVAQMIAEANGFAATVSSPPLLGRPARGPEPRPAARHDL